MTILIYHDKLHVYYNILDKNVNKRISMLLNDRIDRENEKQVIDLLFH